MKPTNIKSLRPLLLSSGAVTHYRMPLARRLRAWVASIFNL